MAAVSDQSGIAEKPLNVCTDGGRRHVLLDEAEEGGLHPAAGRLLLILTPEPGGGGGSRVQVPKNQKI